MLRLCSVFELSSGGHLDARYDPVGGMQSHTGQLTRALDRIGVRQDVITAWRPGCAAVEGLGTHGSVRRVGVPLQRLRQLYALPAWWAAQRRAAAADLVHAHLGEDLAIVPLGLLAALRARRPLVLTLHCSLRHTLAVGDARRAVLRALGGPLETLGVRRAAAVITLTPRLAGLVIGDGAPARRVHVIPSGVDVARFTGRHGDPAPWIGRPRVLFVGRLAPQKGVRTLVDAVPRLPPDAQVVLVGDGPERAGLERRVSELGVADRVTFLGFVRPAQVVAHLTHADVLVLPSVYEELGSVLLEGMQAGLPIVASAVGGIPDVIVDGENGCLVAPGDAAALGARVTEVLGDAGLAERLRAGARAHAHRYRWDVLAQRVLEVYREVATAATPSSTRS